MKGISSKEQDRTFEIPKTILDTPGSSLKVRRSFALLGLALSVGTVGVLVNQQHSTDLRVTPIAQSPQTLADVLSQNQERKYEMARAAIASGTWDKHKGVVVHEVREDETLYKLTQVYQVDAAAIATSNGISAATPLQPGTKLVIPPVSGIVHKVKSGDTLESIAKFYKVPKGDIVRYTALKSTEFLAVDQPLVIPGNVATLIKVREDDAKLKLITERDRLRQRLQEVEDVEGKAVLVSSSKSLVKKQPKFITYKVRNGDTIETIARRYGISQTLIAQNNKLDNLHWLELGRELKIPAGKDTSSMQTVAYNDRKPLKIVFSTTGSLEVQPATSSKTEQKPASTIKPEVLAVKVKAATPMTLPASTAAATPAPSQPELLQAALPSPWDGLMQLAGSDLAKTMPSQPPLEEVAAVRRSPEASPILPVETEPVLKVAALLFPFSPDKLLEQHAPNAAIVKSIPSVQPAQEPSSRIAKASAPATLTAEIIERSIKQASTLGSIKAVQPSVQGTKIAVAPSIQQFNIVEQSIKPSSAKQPHSVAKAPLLQPAAEPSLDISKLAVAPSIQSFDAIEQKPAKQKPAEVAATQPVDEPSVKLLKVAVAPSIPSVAIVEQRIGAQVPKETSTAQPVAEPPVKLPKIAVALSIPSMPSTALEQSSTANEKPTELALLPESEARMTTVEMRRLEFEVEQLNAKVKKAEAEAVSRRAEAARRAEELRRAEAAKAEAAKIAAANISPSNRSDSSFDNSREAIANTGKASPLAPELPELVAKAYLPDASGYGVSTGFIWPSEGMLTSGFGWRWGRVHQGIDIAAPVGTPVLAAAAGTVEYAAWNDGGYGNMIDIRHDDGTITRYGHLNAILVKAGQTVNQSQLIAEMGSTGFSTGPHLHFEIRPGGGRAVDPMTFLASTRR